MNKENSWEAAVTWLRDQPEKRQLVIDSYYDDPLIDAARRYASSSEWTCIARYLEGRSGSALDVGAGRGISSFALAGEGFDVTALEPNPSAIVGSQAIRNLARESGRFIDIVETFSEELPFEECSFDVVFARAVLHHTQDLRAACQEFARVLKPGGLLLAVREHVISRPNDIERFFDEHPLHKKYGGENAFLLTEYRSALSASGLKFLDELAPFDSPINYFPQTKSSLVDAIVRRLWKLPFGGSAISGIAQNPLLNSMVLKFASMFDNRPGRLYSFVLEKQI